jgi:hypothetical protein
LVGRLGGGIFQPVIFFNLRQRLSLLLTRVKVDCSRIQEYYIRIFDTRKCHNLRWRFL